MTVKSCIQQKLENAFELSHIEVINESHKHNVPPGSESHFKLVLVSNAFSGKLPVKRHQLVYRLLADELNSSVHALALHTYTEQEWQALQNQVPASPDCMGGKGR